MSHVASLYADLSAYYDRFCAEVDYPEQCAFAERAHAVFAASEGRDLLDLACGTGQHLQDMLARGFRCTGLDNSAAMLQLAAGRCPGADLLLCDLAAFTHEKAFDLITCFLYSIHYSHPLLALEETLRRAFRALKPGGLLLFDAVDARGIRNDNGVVTRMDSEDATLRFQSAWHYSGEGEVLDLNLTIVRSDAAGNREWQDRHTMTALTFPQLARLLMTEGFDVQLLEHDYTTLRPWAGTGHNAIVAATRPA